MALLFDGFKHTTTMLPSIMTTMTTTSTQPSPSPPMGRFEGLRERERESERARERESERARKRESERAIERERERERDVCVFESPMFPFQRRIPYQRSVPVSTSRSRINAAFPINVVFPCQWFLYQRRVFVLTRLYRVYAVFVLTFNAVFSNQCCLLASKPNTFNSLPVLPPPLPLQPPLPSPP